MRLDAFFDMLPEQAFRPRPGGGMTLEGGKGGGGSSAPAPDPNIGIAQRELSALAKEQWGVFTKDIYPELLKQSQAQEARANEQWAMTKGISSLQLEQAKKATERYETGGIPAMEKIKADADKYSEAGYREQLAQAARADISSAMENQRQQQTMRQRAYGIDPTSGTAQMASAGISSGQALMEAQAMNQTRQAAKDVGLQKQANVYNMYAGLPAQANANTSLALGATGQGFAGGNAAIGNFATTGGALNNAAGAAGGMYNSMGQLGVGATNAAANMWGAQQQANAVSSAGLGQALGSGLGAYAALSASDIRVKQDIKRIGTLLNDVPLYSYHYKPEFRDMWGHGPQIGVMAHEVEHIEGAVVMGEAGYKLVDYSKVMNHGI